VALDANALVTWANTKAVLGFADGDQLTVEDYINAASRTANRYARRKLAARDQTLYLDGTGTPELLLPDWPINTLTSVNSDTGREWGSATALTIATDYLSYADRGSLYRLNAVWPEYRQCIKIVANLGYGSSAVPEDLQHAIYEVVAYMWKRYASKMIGLKQVSGNGVTTDIELTIPVNAQRVFEDFQRDVV